MISSPVLSHGRAWSRSFALSAAVLSGSFVLAIPAMSQEPAPPSVLVSTAESRALSRQQEFIGRVEAREKVELRARVEGFLGARLFKDGDAVKKDQVLFAIEREPLQAALAQRKAQLASARATLENAVVQDQRAKDLIKTNAVAQTTLDQRNAELLRAQADVLDAEAGLRQAEITLSYTEIKSPMDGRIGRAAVSPGNLINPQTGVLAVVVQENPISVLFPVTQRELIEARKASTVAGSLVVRARLADGSFYKELGKIDFFDVIVDPRTDGQIARAVFANPEVLLSSGQTVRVTVESSKADEQTVIPEMAVSIDQTGPYTFVVKADNVVELRRVLLGDTRDGVVAVKDGMKPGERVIVQGQQRVRAGMKVTPQNAPAFRR